MHLLELEAELLLWEANSIMLTRIGILSLLFVLLLPVLQPNSTGVNAQAICTAANRNVIPSCSGQPAEIDFACQRKRLVNPSDLCCLYVCPGNQSVGQGDEIIDVNIFGINIRARDGALLQTLLFVGFNSFLGVVAIVLTFLGIGAAINRANAQSDDDIAKASKTITNAFVGLVMIVLSFVAAQLLASFLGLGSLNDMVDFSSLIGSVNNGN